MKKLSTAFALIVTSILVSISGVSQSAFAEMALAEINYTVKVGKERFLTHFTVCAENEDIKNPTIIIETPQQTKEISVKKVIPAETCQTYETIVHAKYANRITVEVKS